MAVSVKPHQAYSPCIWGLVKTWGQGPLLDKQEGYPALSTCRKTLGEVCQGADKSLR